MPINGGYKVRITPITRGQVAPLKKKETRDGADWLTWLSIGLTITEIAAMFIPGVGPVISTGIAAAGAGAQTAIEYAQTGTVSGTSIGLNAASLFLPGVVHGTGAVIKNSAWGLERAISRVAVEAEKEIKETVQIAIKINGVEDYSAVSKSILDQSQNIIRGAKEASYFKRAEEVYKIFRNEGDMINAAGVAEKFLQHPLVSDPGPNFISEAFGRRIGIVGTEAIDETSREVQKDFSLSENVEREFIDKFGVIDAQELFSRVAKAETAAERQTIVSLFLTEKMSTEEAWVFTQRIREITKGIFRNSTDVAAANKAADAAMEAIKKTNKELYKNLPWKVKANRMLRYIGSGNFNNKVVQIVQLMDPADFGRFFVERLYRRMVKYFKPLMKIIGSVNKIDAAFEKAGGTLVNSNVIVGYRVIGYSKKIPGHSDIMISFYPEMTKSKHATSRDGRANKNYHGKPPVFVTASDAEIKGLIDGGMKYYLRKWAITKGGRPASMNTMEGMGLALMLILPFMQTGMLRNILSLGSNVSKMAKRFAKVGGEGWGEDFLKSLRRAAINRPGRFLARGVIAPVAGRFGRLTALIVSRESQRFIGIATTAANAALEGRKPKSFYKTIQSQIKAATGSYGSRGLRSSGRGSALISQKKYRRKINMVKRLPRAFGIM